MPTLINHRTAAAKRFLDSDREFIGFGHAWRPITTSSITSIVLGNPTSVTVTNGSKFAVGDVVTVEAAVGFNQGIGVPATIAAVAGNVLTLAIDSTAFTPWVAGGYVQREDLVLPNERAVTIGDIDAAIRLDPADKRLAIKRVIWNPGIAILPYDPLADQSTQVWPSYAISGNDVYLCTGAGAGFSTVRPTRPGLFSYSDGFTWLRIGSIDPIDDAEFGTVDYAPITDTIIAIDRGQIVGVDVLTPGTNYRTDDTIRVTGSGSGAACYIATFDTNDGISSVGISNPGAGYVAASLYVDNPPTGSGASFEVRLSDPIARRSISEVLQLNTVLVSKRITGSESGQLPLGEIRSTALIRFDTNTPTIDMRDTITVDTNDLNVNLPTYSRLVGQLSNVFGAITHAAGTTVKALARFSTHWLNGEIVSSNTGRAVATNVIPFNAGNVAGATIVANIANNPPLARTESQVDRIKFALTF